jgi:cytochrome c-type biogenesis protein CcmH/NrfF
MEVYENVKRGKSNTQIHEWSLSWLGRGTLIKRGGVESVVFAQTFIFFIFTIVMFLSVWFCINLL